MSTKQMKGGLSMKNGKMTASMLKGVTKMAEKSLQHNANQTTCVGVYQPKAPAALKKFSKIEK